VGFLQLVVGSQYLTGFSAVMHFYYCTAYATVAVMAVLGCNLYVALVRRRIRIGGAIAIVATLPSLLSTAYFVSAYVNGVSVGLPMFPVLPWPVVWIIFFTASAMVVFAMVAVSYGRRQSRSLPAASSKE
jgi:hypothetical protein